MHILSPATEKLLKILESAEEGKTSPRKNVPDAWVDLGTACIRSRHATDRATTPSYRGCAKIIPFGASPQNGIICYIEQGLVQDYNHIVPKGWCLYQGTEVIKLFSCSTQPSTKIKLLINYEITKMNGIFRYKSKKPVIYPANKC